MKSLASAGTRDKEEKRRKKKDRKTKGIRERKRKTGENRGIMNRFMEGGGVCRATKGYEKNGTGE
jgi:hypothetical protein